jgi:hypothetical protein
MKIAILFVLLFWGGVVGLLVGCGGSTGWRVSFGVSPVTSIEDTQALKEEERK